MDFFNGMSILEAHIGEEVTINTVNRNSYKGRLQMINLNSSIVLSIQSTTIIGEPPEHKVIVIDIGCVESFQLKMQDDELKKLGDA